MTIFLRIIPLLKREKVLLSFADNPQDGVIAQIGLIGKILEF